MVESVNGECRGAAASCSSPRPLTAASARAAAAKSSSVRMARPVDEPVVVCAAGHQTAPYSGVVPGFRGLAEELEWV